MLDVAVTLLTNHLVPYRVPLYERLAAEHELEVLCFGGGERYMGATVDLDAAIAAAPFPARRIRGWAQALASARRAEVVIAAYAGGPVLPAAYAGTRLGGGAFVYWASIWARPRSLTNDLAAPVTRHIHRHADAVIAYGEHVRRYVAAIRGRDDDVFVAPQAVEPELFGRAVSRDEIADFRARHGLGDGPLVLYSGRVEVPKGAAVLAAAWPRVGAGGGTLVVAGEGSLRAELAAVPGVRILGALPREQLPVAYAAAACVVVPSIPTPRFREPWGLVCNEAMHQGTPVIASDAVGAAAGGLVADGVTGCVVPAGDPDALAAAIGRLLDDPARRERLGAAARAAVAAYSYDAMAAAFAQAIAVARARRT